MASTFALIRLRMSSSCPAASVLRWAMLSLATLPEASACAFIAQIISSRQPLPCTVFETPIVYSLADDAAVTVRSAAPARSGRHARDFTLLMERSFPSLLERSVVGPSANIGAQYVASQKEAAFDRFLAALESAVLVLDDDRTIITDLIEACESGIPLDLAEPRHARHLPAHA